MDEYPRLPGQQFGDFVERISDVSGMMLGHRLALTCLDTILEKMVELPHQQWHIKTAMERHAARICRRGREHLHSHKHVERPAVGRLSDCQFSALDAVPRFN